MSEFTIGQLAKETSCKVPTIRYFEKIGMLPEPARSAGNTRIYTAAAMARLTFICHCRELGFPQKVIRELLGLVDHPDQSCETVTEIAATQLNHVNQRISHLAALKGELERMIDSCNGGCVAQCRIVESLADGTHPTS
ncbi:MAG: helix-turn-helix domain-containing protein [Rhodobiaceae bacterium]|nr:helix-turn-helix domain-containing protein [Rhodobiaceae bacterium]